MYQSEVMRRIRLVCGIPLLLLVSSATAIAQNQPAPNAAASSASAASPSFEVATIKRNTSGGGGGISGLGSKTGRFTATDVTIKGLLRFDAFDIADARIAGGPKWLDSARFDIEAKLDPADAARYDLLVPGEKKALKEALVQQLLADRFQFKSHWEDREQPVYALAVAKGGPKLPVAPDTKPGFGYSINNGNFEANDVTLAQVADLLTQGAGNELGRVVVDRTGIAGTFDVNLKWASDTGAASSEAPAGSSLFTAIQEQLGLKLESAKAPVKVLVIDRLEMPSEN
jgi:uncharacterized protein (TIGR03435 family)